MLPLPWEPELEMKEVQVYIELDDGFYARVNLSARVGEVMQEYKVTIHSVMEVMVVDRAWDGEFRKQFKVAS